MVVDRRLSHLNCDTINLLSKKDIVKGLPKLKYVKRPLCTSLVSGKAKRNTFKSKATPSSKRRLDLLHMDLYGPMRDEAPEVLINFLKMIQRGLQAQIRTVRTDRGYALLSKGFRVYNKRTRLIVKKIHVNFDELPDMMSDHSSSGLVTKSLAPQCQHNLEQKRHEPSSSTHVQDNLPSADVADNPLMSDVVQSNVR
ncbi:hypothetical protein Tco_0649236 [Tanacetum coccineum]